MMKILGIFLCIIAIFLLYKRLSLILFGQCTKGIIIGYGNPTKGYKGIEAYPYQVQYTYHQQVYIAYSLESVSTAYGDYPNQHLQKEVTLYFNEKKPEVVTIKEFNATSIMAILLFILGLIGLLV